MIQHLFQVFSLLRYGNCCSTAAKKGRRRDEKRKHALTLIEMIVVMLLIATITGAVAINYQRSLDRGRTFATERRIERLKAIVHIYFAEHPERLADQTHDWIGIINDSGLGSGKPEELLKDDWGNFFDIKIENCHEGSFDLRITSPRLRTASMK